MRIHRVRQGESLSQIAATYGVSVRDLIRYNELPSRSEIVPGLALLVPKGDPLAVQAYTIQTGDTVESISQKFGISPAVFSNWTGYSTTAATLPVGSRVYLPVRRTSLKTIEVNGYLLPSGTDSDREILQDVSQMTYFCSFSYQVRADGSLVAPRDDIALAAAKQARIQPLMTMTNFDGNNFNTTLAHTILANDSLRRRVIDNVLSTCTAKGFGGVNVDFEHMQPSDRPLYNAFIAQLRDALHARNLTVSIAMGPKTGDNPNQSWMGAFDYRTLGEEVDFLMLMTYEWGWVGGPPMAIAPVNQVRAVLEYATSVIDSRKILFGMSLYGYDWPLPFEQGKTKASGLSNNAAQNLAIAEQASIFWDPESASPYFDYEAAGVAHRVWFDDAQSAAIKLSLLDEYNLRGVSVWVLGNEFPQLWYILEDSYRITKL